MTSQKLPLFDRVAYNLNSALASKQIALLGVLPDGRISEDNFIRGDHMPQDVTKQVRSFFQDVASKKNSFTHLGSLNSEIDIYGPTTLAGTQTLLEWVVLSGVIDLHTELEQLCSRTSTSDWNYGFLQLRNALNGVNNWNLLNMAIDFKSGIIITRDMSRLSANHYTSLAQYPMVELKKKYDLFVKSRKLQIEHQRIRDLDKSEAKALALKYLKETFFP